MLISEILKDKVDYKVIEDDDDEFQVEAEINGREIVFAAFHYDKDEQKWEVTFGERDKHENGMFRWDKTGSGGELKVFAMVKTALENLIKKRKPNRIDFSADKHAEGEGRANLYDRMLKKFKIPGYTHERKSLIHSDQFYIRKDGYSEAY